MQSLVYLIFVAFSTCQAHYRGSYDSRNFITRDEPTIKGVLIECPVCDQTDHWMANTEECPIRNGSKTFKICKFGTYTNEVCGKRPDCFSGPGEQCTEKREFDMYGKKCAPGYYCNKMEGVCTGLEFQLDNNWQWKMFPFTGVRSELRNQPEDSKFSFEGIRN
ncbi:unnamed protein product [Spodoptera exigua]|uniref:Uncharacterized protein n=1 Tax=Spodoptera exigua TaxID=7107 RepID=A0A835GFJ9_SPOEX|nr:hypothetical protein HW555_007733 [Spodoptera exigua]CAH0690063.1 unnamed protein product [Spodoptera exigua]